MKNRPTVVIEQETSIDQYIDVIDKLENDAVSEFSKIKLKLHPVVDIKAIIDEIKTKFEDIKARLNESKGKFDSSVQQSLVNDNIIDKIEDLFKGKVNNEPSDIEKKRKDIQDRYKKNIPPGYEDAKTKDEINSCGDGLIWFEILEKAKTDGCSVIFISDDKKDDWVWRISGKRLWCRPELIKEFSTHAPGKIFYSYNMASFFEVSKKYIHIPINVSAIDDAKIIASVHSIRDNFCGSFLYELFNLIVANFGKILSNGEEGKVKFYIKSLKQNLSITDFTDCKNIKNSLHDLVVFLTNLSLADDPNNTLMERFLEKLTTLVDTYNKLAISFLSEQNKINNYLAINKMI